MTFHTFCKKKKSSTLIYVCFSERNGKVLEPISFSRLLIPGVYIKDNNVHCPREEVTAERPSVAAGRWVDRGLQTEKQKIRLHIPVE